MLLHTSRECTCHASATSLCGQSTGCKDDEVPLVSAVADGTENDGQFCDARGCERLELAVSERSRDRSWKFPSRRLARLTLYICDHDDKILNRRRF